MRSKILIICVLIVTLVCAMMVPISSRYSASETINLPVQTASPSTSEVRFVVPYVYYDYTILSNVTAYYEVARLDIPSNGKLEFASMLWSASPVSVTVMDNDAVRVNKTGKKHEMEPWQFVDIYMLTNVVSKCTIVVSFGTIWNESPQEVHFWSPNSR